MLRLLNQTLIIFVLILYVFISVSYAKNIYLKGSVICFVKGDEDISKPSKYVIINADNFAIKPSITNEVGFYLLKVPKFYIDKSITIKYQDLADVLAIKSKFIAEENIVFIDDKMYYNFPTVVLNIPCEKAEGTYSEAKKFVETVVLKERKNKPYGLVPTTIMGVIKMILFIPGSMSEGKPETTIKSTQRIDISEVTRKTINDGELFNQSLQFFSQNIGFNFSPRRNLNESVFWNPSKMSALNNGIATFYTDFNNHIRSSIIYPFDSFSVGIGYLLLNQKENRTVIYGNDNSKKSDDYITNESAFYLSFSKIINNQSSIGCALKYIYQKAERPSYIQKTTMNDTVETTEYNLIKETKRKEMYDFDISFSYQFTNKINMGINIMNLNGSKLYSNDGETSLRSLGLGLTFLHNRINYGIDYYLSEDGKNDISFGIDYIPFNDFRANIAFSTFYNTISIGLEYMSFSISYSRNEEFGNTIINGFKIDF